MFSRGRSQGAQASSEEKQRRSQAAWSNHSRVITVKSGVNNDVLAVGTKRTI